MRKNASDDHGMIVKDENKCIAIGFVNKRLDLKIWLCSFVCFVSVDNIRRGISSDTPHSILYLVMCSIKWVRAEIRRWVITGDIWRTVLYWSSHLLKKQKIARGLTVTWCKHHRVLEEFEMLWTLEFSQTPLVFESGQFLFIKWSLQIFSDVMQAKPKWPRNQSERSLDDCNFIQCNSTERNNASV